VITLTPNSTNSLCGYRIVTGQPSDRLGEDFSENYKDFTERLGGLIFEFLFPSNNTILFLSLQCIIHKQMNFSVLFNNCPNQCNRNKKYYMVTGLFENLFTLYCLPFKIFEGLLLVCCDNASDLNIILLKKFHLFLRLSITVLVF